MASKSQHAVCVPYPTQGHINPMLQLSKILHSKGFHITFVNTIYNHNRLLRSVGPELLVDHPSFRFRAIPDGLPEMDGDSTQDILSLSASTEKHCLGPFKELVASLNKASDAPRVSCMVSDVGMFFPIDAAQEFDVPVVLLWTSSVCGLLSYAHFPKLIEAGLIPFKDPNFITNGDLNKVIDCIPTMNNIRLKDMPSLIRTTDPNDFYLSFTQRYLEKSRKASAILLNTIDEMDQDVVEVLSSFNFPPLYTLGPLHLLVESMKTNNEEEINRISTSLWKVDSKCVEWLDSYVPKSVIYVNFGSLTILTKDQLFEFAWGLANTKQPFLWVLRPDLVIGDSVVLSEDFMRETKGRGLITSWCNQGQVLAHPAIGGFLTHCGWNSTLESVINGVPMICWPFFAEQQTNCWFCCNKLGIGMEIDVSEINRQVRELMQGEKGKKMRSNVMNWRKLAQEAAIAPNGSSYNNLNKVLNVLGSHY